MILNPTNTIPDRLPLEGLRVGISGAVPERKFWGEVPDLDRLILAFVAQLSALVIRYGGQVVHGSQPLLAPVVAEQARRQAREGTTPLKLFASQLFGEIPDVTRRAAQMARADVVLTAQVGEGDRGDARTVNHSLTAMRLAMMQQVDLVVAVGGKLHADTGLNPGVLEELAQARWHGVPCFVVGAFSGAAGLLDHPILEELSSGNLLEDQSPMVKMATWADGMDEYVGKLLGHLARHAGQFRKRPPFRHEPGMFRLAAELGGAADRATVVHVDPEMAAAWSNRFVRLKERVQAKDTDQARRLLSATEF